MPISGKNIRLMYEEMIKVPMKQKTILSGDKYVAIMIYSHITENNVTLNDVNKAIKEFHKQISGDEPIEKFMRTYTILFNSYTILYQKLNGITTETELLTANAILISALVDHCNIVKMVESIRNVKPLIIDNLSLIQSLVYIKDDQGYDVSDSDIIKFVLNKKKNLKINDMLVLAISYYFKHIHDKLIK